MIAVIGDAQPTESLELCGGALKQTGIDGQQWCVKSPTRRCPQNPDAAT